MVSGYRVVSLLPPGTSGHLIVWDRERGSTGAQDILELLVRHWLAAGHFLIT